MPREDRLKFTDVISAVELQNHCDQILEDISLEVTSSHLPNDITHALKGEYNRLSYRLERLQCGSTQDPLAILPPEIWTDILQEAIEDSDSNLSSTEALISLSSVSRDWSIKIFDTPMLWTIITIGCGEGDAQAKLETALYLSRGLSLKLRIVCVLNRTIDGIQLLHAHANRIEEIFILNPILRDFLSIQFSEMFDHILSTIGPLVSLKTIHCDPALVPNWQSLFAYCPALRYIYGIIIPFDTVQSRSGGLRLRGYSTGAPPNKILAHLEDLVDLETLDWIVYDNLTKNIPPILTTPIPALRMIRDYITIDAGFFAVLRLAGRLTCLIFTVDDKWQHLYDLFGLFPNLPHLRDLTLYVQALQDDFAWPFTETTKTRVRNLKIRYLGIHGDSTNETHERIFHVISPYFPSVTHLILQNTCFGPSVGRYIRSAVSLSYLHLWHVTLAPDYAILLESASLEVLELASGTNKLDVITLDPKCALLSKLIIWGIEIRTMEPYDWEDSAVYSQITHLQTNLSQPPSKFPCFDALHKLQLIPNKSAMAVIIGLILQPEVCPKLERIDFGFIPEWDLIFIMLEQRNYFPKSRRIARIDTLTFPSSLPPVILVPLAEILGGHFTKRLPNRDISFGGIMEAYFDMSILGCERCHRVLKSCLSPIYLSTEPGNGMPGWSQLAFTSMNLPLKPPTVPFEVWEWLQKRQDRLDEWNKRGTVGRYRVERREICAEMELEPKPFTVTAHSCTDIMKSQLFGCSEVAALART